MHGICHFEIPSADVEKSKAFYASLFGWDFQADADPGYAMFSAAKGPGGAVEKAEAGRGTSIRIYIEVEDIPDALAKVEKLGGQVLKEKTLISDEYGYWAMVADPSGVQVGLWSKT